jgi:hypothetical protein
VKTVHDLGKADGHSQMAGKALTDEQKSALAADRVTDERAASSGRQGES